MNQNLMDFDRISKNLKYCEIPQNPSFSEIQTIP